MTNTTTTDAQDVISHAVRTTMANAKPRGEIERRHKMDTALMEKNRVADEGAAHDFALKGITGKEDVSREVRSLKERLKLAKDIGAKGQILLIEKVMKRVQQAYKIAHQNPYPECNKTDAMDAMCEPVKENDQLDALKGLAGQMAGSAKGKLDAGLLSQLSGMTSQVQRSILQKSALQSAFGNIVSYQQYANMMNDPWSRGYSRQTHKYDLSCEPLRVDTGDGKYLGFGMYEGQTDSQTLLPMSALCRLKEATDKKMFDAFEVWRPAEWKAPDPWLVGVWIDDQNNKHFYKVCDWR